jgi:hypothetical protein
MKRNMIIKTLGTAVLLASVGITGCNIKTDDDSKSDRDDDEEEISCEVDDEDLSGCCEISDEEDEEYYSCCVPEYCIGGTNGELPGQLDYMTLVPPCDRINWADYETSYITDLSVIDSDDLRAIAEEYAGEGYDIVDPEQDQEYGLANGDGEYMFTTGFRAERIKDHSSEFIYAYEMNEDLFDYFFVDDYYDDIECSDDGIVIRYETQGYIAEYNRDTGIGFLYIGCSY